MIVMINNDLQAVHKWGEHEGNKCTGYLLLLAKSPIPNQIKVGWTCQKELPSI